MLNRAHYLHRQAEKAARKGNIEQAIQLHKQSADILRDLLQGILNEKIAESVRLQAELHEKEQTMLQNQRRQSLKTHKTIVSLKLAEGVQIGNQRSSATASPGISTRSSSAMDRRSSCHEDVVAGDSLHESIYRKFQETENLLDQLKIQDDQWSTISTPRRRLQTFSPAPIPSSEMTRITVGGATKRPKDDKVIIEELQVANCHLRKMVDTLFLELSGCQRENRELKVRIRQLDGLLRESHGLSEDVLVHTCSLRRGLSNKSLANAHLQHSEDLPALDMPAFDFGCK